MRWIGLLFSVFLLNTPAGAGSVADEQAAVAGLVCTEAQPLLDLADRAEQAQSPQALQLYMREDLPRMAVCGKLAQPVEVRIQTTEGRFRLDGRGYRILRVRVEETGESVYVVQRD